MYTSIIDALNDARRRVLAGEDLSLDEQHHFLQLLRDARGTVPQPAAKKASGGKKAKAAISDEQLDSDLDSLLGL